MKTARPVHALAGLVASFATQAVAATGAQPERWQLNLTPGVTETAQRAYDMHMWMLWICVVIGIVVFGAMAVAIFRFRKSKGAVADKTFVHSTRLEVLWTVIPTLILVVMAVPATIKTIDAHDTRGHEMTVKIIGQQWLWTYEYVGEGVRFTSRLDRDSERIRQSGRVPTLDEHGAYLLDNVDALGFTQEELHRLSLLVLGHRGKLRKLEADFEDEGFVHQLLCLRIAVILCHARRDPDVEGLLLQAAGRQLRLSVRRGWAAAWPQSAHLLRQESVAWQKMPWSLDSL